MAPFPSEGQNFHSRYLGQFQELFRAIFFSKKKLPNANSVHKINITPTLSVVSFEIIKLPFLTLVSICGQSEMAPNDFLISNCHWLHFVLRYLFGDMLTCRAPFQPAPTDGDMLVKRVGSQHINGKDVRFTYDGFVMCPCRRPRCC